MQNKETWDLFDANENFMGVFVKGQGYIPSGLFHKTVEVIPTDMAGNMLLLRRSYLKRQGGGTLEFPAGSVISGEKEKDAAVRELKEETGLRPKSLYFLQKGRTGGVIRYTFLAYIPDLTQKRIDYSPEEVMEHEFVTYEQWIDLLPSGEYNAFRTRLYTSRFLETTKALVNKNRKNTVAEDPQKEQVKEHKPLREAATLAVKVKRHTVTEQPQVENDISVPDWEPSYEQGDDGA